MKEIIEKLIERGWDPKLTRRHSMYSGPILEMMFSLADIINDNEAMRLLFPTDWSVSPHNFKYYQQQLVVMETEEKQIKYIKEHMI